MRSPSSPSLAVSLGVHPVALAPLPPSGSRLPLWLPLSRQSSSAASSSQSMKGSGPDKGDEMRQVLYRLYPFHVAANCGATFACHSCDSNQSTKAQWGKALDNSIDHAWTQFDQTAWTDRPGQAGECYEQSASQ
jgi:hypothetical protein